MNYYIGVDVGTGSVRAGIFDATGKKIAMDIKNITTWSYNKVFKEQSSNEIWKHICEVVKSSINKSGIDKNDIKGIGFDATCSLVALDENKEPVSLNCFDEKDRNIILWMDHRAKKETDFINSKAHKVLDFVGGKISIEMEIPKILWVKNNLPESYEKIKYYFDLPDFLVFKATGKIVRSLCSLSCKWNYMSHKGKWEDDFIEEIGLKDIIKNDYEKIGGEIKKIGEKAGNLSKSAQKELGLNSDVVVGISMIDAHAGGLGVIGIDDGEEIKYENRIALIGGTSSCHLAINKNMIKVPGVWGPYYGAMLPDMWLLEGGQSATGALIDYIIKNHSAYNDLVKQSVKNNTNIYDELNMILMNLSVDGNIDVLTENLHILPYFIGNRSPRANSKLQGVIVGMNMDNSLENLALNYLATIQSIAYGTRHIIETMNEYGFNIDKIFMTGGGTKNPVFLKAHSNITSCNIILGSERESVLLGASMLGAVANKEYENIYLAMKNMSSYGEKIFPNKQLKDYHNKKYKVFKKMYENYLSYQEIMNNKNM